MLLYWREKEEALSLFKAWSWAEKDLKTALFKELINSINKENIDTLETELLKIEGVTDFNDLPTNYRLHWQDLSDFIKEEE